MIFHILVGQRKCSYPGEYAPEALEVMDDNAMSDHAEYLRDKLKDYRDSEEFDSIVTIQVRVPDAQIDELLFPASKVFECVPIHD